MSKFDSSNQTGNGSMIGTVIGAIFFAAFGIAFAGGGVMMAAGGYHRDGWKVVLFCVPFVVIGLALATLAFAMIPMQRRRARRQAENPDQPWLWDSASASNTISDHAAGGAIGAWILAAIVDAIVVGVAIGILSQRHHQPAQLFALIFLALAIWLTANAIGATLRVVRFGQSVLKLNPMPGQIGGRLAGVIHVAKPLAANTPIKLRLTCTRRTHNGKSSTSNLEYEDEQQNDPSRHGGSFDEIPVEFAIPANQPSTRPAQSTRDSIEWKLEARAVGNGVDYLSRFAVPVFEVDRPDVIATEAEASFSTAVKSAANNLTTIPAKIYTEPAVHPGIVLTRLSDGGCTIHFAAGRNWGSAIFVTLLAIALDVGSVLIRQTKPPLFAELIVWLFGILLSIGTLYAWLSSATVTARPSGLSIDSGLPLLRSRRTLPADAISDIVESIGSTAGNSVYYQISAVNGTNTSIVRGVRDKRVIEWLVLEIKRSLRITGAKTKSGRMD